MKLILLSALFIGTYCGSPMLEQSWNLFKTVHAKQYSSISEELQRRDIWTKNIAKIQAHNLEADLGLHTFTMKMNKYGDLSDEEFRKTMYGLKTDQRIEKNFDRHTFIPPSNIVLPAAIDWRKEGYVTDIKDQQQCGSCWAFSATGALEGQHFKKYKKLNTLSDQNLIDCSGKYGNEGCNGGYMDSSFQYIKDNKGIDTQDSYPYEARDGDCRFKAENVGANDTGFVDIKTGNETDLQIAIATVGPISIAIDCQHDSFRFYSSGVYDEPQCSTSMLDLAILAVGYDTINGQDYYIVKNGWGKSWGMEGYIWMSRNKNNQCGIATLSSYPLV